MNTEVFVVRNQHGHYWGKAKCWVDGYTPRAVMRTEHRDEAINTLFELSSRDIGLRGEVLAAALTERGDPAIEPSPTPLPQAPDGDVDPLAATPDSVSPTAAEP